MPSRPERAAADLRVAAVTPFTSIDFPGRLAAVVFTQGCPWRCLYCHNPWMQPREPAPGLALEDWGQVLALLRRRRGLLDGVVFSGGEPCGDPALPAAMREARRLGLRIGLHTSGAAPGGLREALPLVDWVGLDVKAPPDDPRLYEKVSGRPHAARAFAESWAALRRSGVPYEARLTAHPLLLDDAAIRRVGRWLRERGCRDFALQVFRPAPGLELPLPPVASDYPAPATLAFLTSLFPRFTLRRG